MLLNAVHPLFPELDDPAALQDFLARISGSLVGDAASPVDRTGDLTHLGALCDRHADARPAMFDSFARAFCTARRPEVEAAFAGSPLTAAHAGALVDEFLAWITERVQQASVRTLVVVLDLLRGAGALPGESSDERLWHFCDLAGRAEFRATLFAVFPELGRHLTVLADNALSHLHRMLRTTGAAIAEGWLPVAGDRAELTAIAYGLGDTHAGGQTVCRLTFGTGPVLFYKPRPMAIERAYADFVERVNEATAADLPILRVWCGDDCGWQEYADQSPARCAPEYFRSAGHLLAVLHILRASDMHYENVLNHRGLPVVVDAESLFSVNRRRGDGREQSPEIQALAHTVFSTGFLPSRIGDPGGADASIDIGFLGYVPGQRAVASTPMLDGFGTDRPQVTFVTTVVETAAVRPADVGRGVELDQLSQGFAEIYDWAAAHTGQLTTWLRQLFEGLKIRSVLEATSKYQRLLQTSTHPTFQLTTAMKELLLHRIGLGRIDHVTAPVVQAEIRDLMQGDIPYFTLRTDSTWVYHGDAPIAEVLARTPLAEVVAGVQGMSADGHEQNLRVIRATYVDLTEPECDVPAYAWRVGRRAAGPALAGRTRETVDAIAGELYDAVVASTRDSRPAWIGATIRDTSQEHPWRVGGLADDLYSGVSGVSVFLAAAGVLVDNARYLDVARRALGPRVQDLLDDPARRRREVNGGLGGGYPGLAFSALEVGRLTGSAELTGQAARLWSMLSEDLPLITETDLLMGSAGLLAAALTVGQPAVTEAAFRHLRASLIAPPQGRIYSGFAHGTSGIIAALARYSAATGGAVAELATLIGVHEELHNDAAGHWPISNLAPDQAARGWCHGTPGVLLGVTERLAAGVPPSSRPHSDVATLAEIVAGAGFGLNLSLCHGDVGNLVILDQAGRWDPSGRTAERVADRRAQLAARIVPRMLAARVGKSVLNPSLYVGLAGIGLGLTLLTGEVDVASPLTWRREAG